MYHFVVLLLLHHWHHESGDDSPLDVQDVDGLVILREEFNTSLSLNCDLQGEPVDVARSSVTAWPLCSSSCFMCLIALSFMI